MPLLELPGGAEEERAEDDRPRRLDEERRSHRVVEVRGVRECGDHATQAKSADIVRCRRLGIPAMSASWSSRAVNATPAIEGEFLKMVTPIPNTTANWPAIERASASCVTNAPSGSTLNNPHAEA